MKSKAELRALRSEVHGIAASVERHLKIDSTLAPLEAAHKIEIENFDKFWTFTLDGEEVRVNKRPNIERMDEEYNRIEGMICLALGPEDGGGSAALTAGQVMALLMWGLDSTVCDAPWGGGVKLDADGTITVVMDNNSRYEVRLKVLSFTDRGAGESSSSEA